MELKPSKNFKMASQTKRTLALILDPHERGRWKRAMIQAQLASEQIVKSKKERDRK
jgi:hypothetical protein